MAKTFTEREVFDYRIGRVLEDDEIIAITPKRDRANALSQFERGMIYKRCDICFEFICVNNWEDRKVRTPVFKDFIVCVTCDPRRAQDRYERKHYQVIFPGRLRIINMARVTRALARHGCLRYEDPNGPCKCAGCAAGKLFADG